VVLIEERYSYTTFSFVPHPQAAAVVGKIIPHMEPVTTTNVIRSLDNEEWGPTIISSE
jgi:hypothetical protein